MIAPVKRPKTSATSPGIRRARQLLASMLLMQRPRPPEVPPSVPAWRAWLLTGWVVVVVAAYVVSMAGWF